jgi:adenylosuccinate synthase
MTNETVFRKNSFAFCGGVYGDEGKGRIVDQYVSDYRSKGPVVVYRDNGGSNAGHTVEFADPKDPTRSHRIALHQLPSGVLFKEAVVVLGKGMVLHPGDLLSEFEEVIKAAGKIQAKVKIDEMAVLTLDTHRAFEAVLKDWQSGGKGSTGRGISPAYADVLLRHPLRMRDLATFDKKVLTKHYQMYEAFVKGLGRELAEVEVPTLEGKVRKVGSLKSFLSTLKKQAEQLRTHVEDVGPFLRRSWGDKKTTFIFEKSQAIGLDPRWGVYPDVTASDTTFDGIFSATEGIIDPDEIGVRAAVIKATYMSSVGIRVLPTMMEEALAHRIREDAHEYGATTKRPRDIAYLDLPALRYFIKVGRVTHLALTHMDIVYPDVPVKICIAYKKNGKEVGYRPDQEYLNQVKPVYTTLPTWDQMAVQQAKTRAQLPKEARQFLKYLEKEIGVPVLLITTGPKREQGISFH